MFTVPLTTPPGAVAETATVEVGRVVSIVTRQAAGCPAVREQGVGARTKKQNVPSPGTAKCSAVRVAGVRRRRSCAGRQRVVQAPGAR